MAARDDGYAPPAEMEMLVESNQGGIPEEVRLGFVKKVYAIVGTLLLVTLAVTVSTLVLLPHSFYTRHCAKCRFTEEIDNSTSNLGNSTVIVDHNGESGDSQHCRRCGTNSIISSTIVFVFLVIVLFPPLLRVSALLCPGCTWCTQLRASFDRMMATSPWNYIYLFIVCFSEGLLWAVIVANLSKKFLHTFPIVVISMVLTIFGITLAAAWLGKGFTGLPLQIAVLVGGVIPGSLHFLLVHDTLMESMFTGFITASLACTAIRETKAIFGVGGTPRRGALTYDMYAFGAYDVYMTTVVFIGMGC